MNRAGLLIRAGRTVTPAGVIAGATVRVHNGTIAAIGQTTLPPDAAVDVLQGDLLLPGFIDLHWHGYAGNGLDSGAEQAAEAVRLVAASGVTTCYAGLGAGASIEAIAASVAGAAAVAGTRTGGARLAGIFMEGPYINVAKRGAWNAAQLRLPVLAELELLIVAAHGWLRRVNVAPELPGALAFIRAARAAGIAVSLGHSDATYDEAIAGIEAGATIANHTYNAMSGLEQRRPGLAGAVLSTDALLAELILDGVHVHPAAARVLYRARGAGGIALITDGVPFSGLPDGSYRRGGREVIVEQGSCHYADGTLAGSVSTFDRDLRNAAAWLAADPIQLAALSSGNAARAMGLDGHTGAIAPGMDADLVLLDAGLQVQATVVAGEVVYRRPARQS